MSADLNLYDEFEFRGNRLPLLADSRGRYVSFSRACNMLGLDVLTEWHRIQGDEALASQTRIEMQSNTGAFLYYLRAEAVPMWMYLIPNDRMPPQLKAVHAAFKTDLVRAVYDYTTKGVAVKEGTPLVQVLKEVGEYALRLNPSEKTRLAVSSAIESELMRIAGRNGVGEMAVTVASRIQERGLKLKQADVNAIGQAMAKAYRAKTGREPETFPQTIEGATRFVKSYRTADVPMLDRMIDEHMRRKQSR